MRTNQKGFSAVHIVIGIVVLLIIGAVGWRLMASKEPKKSIEDTCTGVVGKSDPPVCIPRAEETKITNFEQCAAAGNPIMESFPEQCAANGQTFTNTTQQAPASPTSE